MSKYIKLATGEVKTQGEWRAANKHISLPKVWKADTLAALGLTPVLATPKPSATELQTVVSAGTTTDALGNTVEAWEVVDKYNTLLENGYVVKTKTEQEEEHLAKVAEDAKQLRIKEAELVFAEEVKNITAGYTDEEIKTWDKQIGEAAVYTADATAPTPLLDALTAATGESKEDLVGRIQVKSDAYAAAIGASLGKKQKAIIDLGAA